MTPRYIDAEQLICDIDGSECLDTERDYEEIASRIDECETADVEKVIRCKNCRFANCELSVVRYYGAPFLCARTGLLLLDGNGYCSWAELATDRPIEKEENE